MDNIDWRKVERYMDAAKDAALDAYGKAVKAVSKTETEQKLAEALSDENWGASSTLLREIADLTNNYKEYSVVMREVWQAVEENPKRWRQIYKGLTLLDYLVKNGSDRCVDEAIDRVYQIRKLTSFSSMTEGVEKGLGVREKSKALVELLSDKKLIKEERERAKQLRDKYMGISRDDYRSGGPTKGRYNDPEPSFKSSTGTKKSTGGKKKPVSKEEDDDAAEEEEDEDEEEVKPKKGKKKTTSSNGRRKGDEDEDEEEEAPKATKSSTSKKTSSKKKAEEDEGDEEEAEEVKPKGKLAIKINIAKTKTGKSSKKQAEEEEEEVEEPVVSKGTEKKKQTQAKSKRPEAVDHFDPFSGGDSAGDNWSGFEAAPMSATAPVPSKTTAAASAPIIDFGFGSSAPLAPAAPSGGLDFLSGGFSAPAAAPATASTGFDPFAGSQFVATPAIPATKSTAGAASGDLDLLAAFGGSSVPAAPAAKSSGKSIDNFLESNLVNLSELSMDSKKKESKKLGDLKTSGATAAPSSSMGMFMPQPQPMMMPVPMMSMPSHQPQAMPAMMMPMMSMQPQQQQQQQNQNGFQPTWPAAAPASSGNQNQQQTWSGF